MANKQSQTPKSIIDYSKWNDIVDEEVHINVEQPFYAPFTSPDDSERVTIPRSPRPQPAEAPALSNGGLLEPPPFNAPKGAAAVRHYQIGFGRNIINKKKTKHRKAASMTVFDQMQTFLDQNEHLLNDDNDDESKKIFKECGNLLEFMINEETKTNNISPSHHDYFLHNPQKYENTQLPNVDVIVKMGGAFITNKHKFHCLQPKQIEIASKQILEAFEANYRMILIHGAGSFGHFEAKKYKLDKGLYFKESSKGMVLCRAAVSILHQHIFAKLLEYKLPIISVSANSIISSSDGIVSRAQLRPFILHIFKILKQGMIPLIHGDIVFDDKRGCHILSGDQILEILCSALHPQRAVFWSDINGVYDCTQSEKYELIQSINVNGRGMPMLNAEIIKQIKNPSKFFMNELKKKWNKKEEKDNENESKKEKKNIGNVCIDATGGMWAKIEVASRCCAQGIDVVITKGGTEDAKLALLGKYAPNATVFVPSGDVL